MKTIDGNTGRIIDDGLGDDYGSATQTGNVTANAVANQLGVPVGWVILAGLALLILPRLFKRK